eukprot:4448693-Amphidinium_carterae.1
MVKDFVHGRKLKSSYANALLGFWLKDVLCSKINQGCLSTFGKHAHAFPGPPATAAYPAPPGTTPLVDVKYFFCLSVCACASLGSHVDLVYQQCITVACYVMYDVAFQYSACERRPHFVKRASWR